MTRGDVIFSVSRTLSLDSTPKDVDNPGEELLLMQRWVNQGIRDVLNKTRCRLDESEMTLIGGESSYRIDDDILAVDEVSLGPGVGGPMLTEVDNQTLNDRLRSGATISGTVPDVYYIKGDYLRVAPVPPAGVVLHYFYVPRPAEIPADGTTANDSFDLADGTYGGIPQEFHDAVELYCLWQGARYDDVSSGARGRTPGATYHDDYVSRIKEVRKELRGKAGRGMHRARIGYPSLPVRRAANDVYPAVG